MKNLASLALLFGPFALGGCASTVPGPPVDPVAVSDRSEHSRRQILVTLEQTTPPPLQRAGTTPKPYSAGRRYNVTPRTRKAVARLAREYGLREVDGWPIKALGVYCVVFEIPEDTVPLEILTRLAQDPRVDSAQPMQIFEVAGESSYNDPYLHLQHGVESMQIHQAHRWAVGEGVTVAIVDSGVDLDHPELAGRISVAEDFVNDGSLEVSADLHGTAVAGVIASAAGNGIGIVGVAPRVRLMVLKACWEDDRESQGARCSSFTLAKAIAYAVDAGPDVLNLSLTGPADPLLARLVEAALGRGMVIVAAQGESPGFPSSVEGVIAVWAREDGGTSATGSMTPPGESTLLAPGEEILTITPDGAYDFVSGSSFAAAHVSGVAALVLELEPKLGAEPLHHLLLEASTKVGRPGNPPAMVNACAALAELVPEGRCVAMGPAS